MKRKNVSLHATKGWGSLYVMILLNFVLTLLLYQSQRLLSLKKLYELDLKYEEVEVVAIQKINDDYLNFKEEDSTIRYKDMDIFFDYEGLVVTVSINDGNKLVRFQAEFDDIDNCIVNFVYLK